MLTIIISFRELKTAQLLQVYQESLILAGKMQYPHLSDNLQILEAEQDFYSFLKDFFSQKDAFLAVWDAGQQYVSALRIAPYRDGVLLTGLETAPDSRKRGYAIKLMSETMRFLSCLGVHKVYSHIRKDNTASISVHQKAGFQRINDGAAFLDGSADIYSGTYLNII